MTILLVRAINMLRGKQMALAFFTEEPSARVWLDELRRSATRSSG